MDKEKKKRKSQEECNILREPVANYVSSQEEVLLPEKSLDDELERAITGDVLLQRLRPLRINNSCCQSLFQ